MTPTQEQKLQVMGEETMQKLVAAEKRIAELEAENERLKKENAALYKYSDLEP